MTGQQVDRIVENPCMHLKHAIRVTGTEAFPSNLRELASEKTALNTGLHAAGISVTPPLHRRPCHKKRCAARLVTAPVVGQPKRIAPMPVIELRISSTR
jgi:hypothetical protein